MHRPFGASELIMRPNRASLHGADEEVELPASFLIAAESLLDTTRFAPKLFASSNFTLADVNAVTSQPDAAGEFHGHVNPSPPMPMMPTRLVGLRASRAARRR